MRVFLVPGHGAHDPGCIGPTGLQEKTVALAIAHRLERLLVAAGHVVGLSRTGDTYLSPTEQARAANRWDSDVVLALHLNAVADPAARGFEVWTSKGQTRSDRLATEIFQGLGEMFPGEPGRTDKIDGDPDKESNFSVLMAWAPAVLVEFGFLSHPETEAKFRRDAVIDLAARAVAVGLDRWISRAKGAHA